MMVSNNTKQGSSRIFQQVFPRISSRISSRISPRTQGAPVLCALAVGISTIFASGTVNADTRTTEDYLAIDVEAEDLDSGDDRWTLTDPSTAQTDQDPDPNHSDQAVGNVYLELLPDVRVTHDDEFGPPTAFWGSGGPGPDLNYSVDFPEAGRYFVHVRVFATGTEDNGIHVGLNGDFPDHGERIQWCTAGRGWSWSSAQRDSGGHACGTEKTIWIQVPSAGTHTVTFTAREDGVELDRFMLIKDLSSNTRICSPSGANDIDCRNGSLVEKDEVVDLAAGLASNRSTGEVEDQFTFTASVENLDPKDTAENVSLTFDLGIGSDWEIDDVPSGCQNTGSTVECELGSLAPEEEGGSASYALTATALTEGVQAVEVSVATSTIDEDENNDTESLEVRIDPLIRRTTLETSVNAPNGAVEERERFTVMSSVTNTGNNTALAPSVSIVLPQGLEVESSPALCQGSGILNCTLPDIAAGESNTIVLTLSGAEQGLYPVTVSTLFDNNEELVANVSAMVSVVPIADVSSAQSTVESSGQASGQTSSQTSGQISSQTSGQLTGETIPAVNSSEEAGDIEESEDTASRSGTSNSSGSAGFITVLFIATALLMRRRRYSDGSLTLHADDRPSA